MTSTRPFDPVSVIDQLLAGRSPSVPGDRQGPDLSSDEMDYVESIVSWCARQDRASMLETPQQVPGDVLDELRQLGAFRITIPAAYGGLGFSDACLLAVLAVLTTAHATLCEIVAAHQVIGAVRPLVEFGTEEQRARYLPELVDTPSAFALNEPELGYGLEPLSTTACFDAEHDCYRVSGTKTWITNATIASHIVVLVDVTGARQGRGGVTALLVKATDIGVMRGPRSTFAGLQGLPNGQLRLDDAQIPADRLIGVEGDGFDVALACLAQCRAALPVACLVTTTTCLSYAAGWAREERQTRRGLHRNPQIQRHLSQLMTLALIANAVTWFALDRGCAATDAEAAKLILSETASQATDTLLQLVGGRGFETAASAAERQAAPWPVERLWRDTRVTRIFDSSTELLKDFLAQPFAPGSRTSRAGHEPSGQLTTAFESRLIRFHDGLRHGDGGGGERAAAIDCAIDLFTLYCVGRYQREIGEDARSTTVAWDVVALELHRRIDSGLDVMSDPRRLERLDRLAAELASDPAAIFAPAFRQPLIELGVHR